jgi:hypothetical protein
MPNNDENGKSNTKHPKAKSAGKRSTSWKPPVWLEKGFFYMFFFVALFATVALFLWSLATFIVPLEVYSRESHRLELSNGQILQVKYPNFILGDNKPMDILLILYGKSNGTLAEFTVEIPSGLTVRKPAAQEYGKTLKLTASGLGSETEPEEIKISLVNSRIERGVWLSVEQPIVITSPQLQGEETIHIGAQTTFWAALQAIVNNPANEKNALILFIASLLSGTGTLILQYMKTQQDRVWEDQKLRRERIAGVMRDDYEEVISVFLQLREEMKTESLADLTIYEELLAESNWRDRLQVIVLKYLQEKDGAKAKRIADNLLKLCDAFNSAEDRKLFQALLVFSDLVSIMKRKQQKNLQTTDTENMLIAAKNWQDELSSIAIDLIQYFGSTSEAESNYQRLKKTLGKDSFGKDLLERSNLQHVLKTQSIDLDENDKDIFYYLNWRPLWTGAGRKPSAKTQRWLQQNGLESKSFTFSSEYAELDNHLIDGMIGLPVLEQIGGPDPAIIFAAEGMGKTAAALWWVKRCQDAATSSGSQGKIFPIYASFEVVPNIRAWMVEMSSRALIKFLSGNPRRFLNAPDNQKNAMSRLMLYHTKDVDALFSSLRNSAFASVSGETDRIIEYVKRFPCWTPDNLTVEDILSLFYLARPEGFDQIYFMWDIRSSSSHKELVRAVKEIEPLILPLARQNVVIKAFAPLTAKKALGRLVGFSAIHGIVWSDQQLRDLLDRRIERFEALWKQGTKDPTGLVVSKSNSSPRRVLLVINKLLEYVEMYLGEGDKLTQSMLNEVISGLQS